MPLEGYARFLEKKKKVIGQKVPQKITPLAGYNQYLRATPPQQAPLPQQGRSLESWLKSAPRVAGTPMVGQTQDDGPTLWEKLGKGVEQRALGLATLATTIGAPPGVESIKYKGQKIPTSDLGGLFYQVPKGVAESFIETAKQTVPYPPEEARKVIPSILKGQAPPAPYKRFREEQAKDPLQAVDRAFDLWIMTSLAIGGARAVLKRIPAEKLVGLEEAAKVYNPQEIRTALVGAEGAPEIEAIKILSVAERKAAITAGLQTIEETVTPKLPRLRELFGIKTEPYTRIKSFEIPGLTEEKVAGQAVPRPVIGEIPPKATPLERFIKPAAPEIVKPITPLGEIFGKPPAEVSPLKPPTFKPSPAIESEYERIHQEMDETIGKVESSLKKTFGAEKGNELAKEVIARGGIARHVSGELRQEYNRLPLNIKNSKGLPGDQMASEIGMSETELYDKLNQKAPEIDFSEEALKILDQDPAFKEKWARLDALEKEMDLSPPFSGGGITGAEKRIQEMMTPADQLKRVLERAKPLGHKFEDELIDRFGALRRFSRYVEGVTKEKLPLGKDPYVAARLYSGRMGEVETAFDDLRNILKPVQRYRDEMTTYLLAKRATERGIRGFLNPAGVSELESEAAISEMRTRIGEPAFGEIEKTATGFYDWADKNILRRLKESGVISDKAYQAIREKNKYYAPFQVLEYLPENIDQLPVGSEIFSVSTQKIIKGLKGTEKAIADPFEAITTKLIDAVNVSERNLVARKLINLREVDPEIAKVIIPAKTTQRAIKGYGSVSAFIDGKVQKYMIPKELEEGIKQLTPKQMDWMSKAIKSTSSAFRAGVTTYNLPFSLGNAPRDYQMALLASKYGFSPADWVKGFVNSLPSSFGFKTSLYKEFLQSHAGYGGLIHRVPKIAAKKLFEPGIIEKIKTFANPAAYIKAVSQAVELAPRMGIFAKTLKKGTGSLTEAAIQARQATIDFSRAGTAMKQINQFVPFINARAQARVTLAGAFQSHPFRAAAKALIWIVLPGVGTYLYNRTYYPDLYDDIPEWEKDNNFILITGSKKDEETGRDIPRYVRLPKGDVGTLFINPIENFLDFVYEKDPKSLQEMAVNWLSEFSAVGFEREGELSLERFLAGILPPAIRAPIETTLNRTFFTGRPIVPRKLEKVAPEEQYTERTGELAKWLGRKVGVSPMKTEAFVRQTLGGAGTTIISPGTFLESLGARYVREMGGETENKAWNLRDKAERGYQTARIKAQRALEKKNSSEAWRVISDWNKEALPIFDQIEKLKVVEAGELNRIKKANTFQYSDLQRLLRGLKD